MLRCWVDSRRQSFYAILDLPVKRSHRVVTQNSDPGFNSQLPALEMGFSVSLLSHEGTVSELRAAIRSSIRSRSTSQYLSDERRRLCVDSNWVEASSCGIAHRIALLCLLAPRLDFDVLERVRLSRPALINDSPFS